MNPRAERFLAHIKGQEGMMPPVLLLWRGDEYLGVWDMTPEEWATELFDVLEGSEFTHRLIDHLVDEKAATAALVVLHLPFGQIASYMEKGLTDTTLNGKPTRKTAIRNPFNRP